MSIRLNTFDCDALEPATLIKISDLVKVTNIV